LRLRQLLQKSDDSELLEAAQRLLAARAKLDAAPPPPIVLRHVADIVEEHRETQWLDGLHKILERRVIALLAGVRDTLKSFIATHWAMTAAVKGERVVILSGEGLGLGRRIEAWMKEFAPARKLRELQVIALEKAVRLQVAEVMAALVAAINAAGITPTLIVIDTLSKFTPGMKENAQEEVSAFLDQLSAALRERYDCTILLVAHAGHGDAKRPRGSSVLMANPDAEYIAEKPDRKQQNVLVSRDRFKDSPAFPTLAYTANVADLGRLDRYGEPVTTLVLWEAAAGELIASKRALKGAAQKKLLAALQELSPDGSAIWTLEDIRSIGAKELELPKSTARYAANHLTTSGHLSATAGGWRLNP
jgi:KaiC/GvpD/RAD55 family RecA-like ATPase